MQAHLEQTAQGLVLTDGALTLRADFSALLPRLKPGRLSQELLVRAARIKGAGSGDLPRAVDATAGLGEDALLLAAAGFEVTLFERDAVIAALLRDALMRAQMQTELAAAAARMHFVEGDSVERMPHLGFVPQVVLLDPMFPQRTKSAAVKKKFQLLHQLESPCTDEQALLDAARAAHPRKVVIKRPPKGPYLAGVAPSYSLQGKAVRYDVLALA